MAQLDCAIPLLSSGSDVCVLASLMDGTVKLCHDGEKVADGALLA